MINRLQQLYGNSINWLRIVCWMAISLAAAQAILSLFFIIYSGFVSENHIYGIKGIIDIWSDPRYLHAILNSFYLALVVSVTLTLLSATVSLIFRWCYLTGNKFIYSLSIIPLLIPDQVFGIVGRMVFDPSIGILGNLFPKSLLIDHYSAIGLIGIVTVIKWLPVMIVVSDSSILAMGRDELFQISMDYSSFLKAVRSVYLPQMKNVLFIIFSLGFLIGFRQHELAYELTSSGGGFVAETWSIWNYRVMFEFNDIARASIESLFVLVLLLIPILTIRKQAQNLSKNAY